MGSNYHKDIKKAVEQIRSEAEKEAHARARYRAQNDFNTELIDEIAQKTGHETLACTCYANVTLDSYDNLDVRVANDWTVIEGIYSSKSSYHQYGGRWRSIKQHYKMHKDEFWERKESGNDIDGGYGTVDAEWMADNFWDGIVYVTNGWPLGDAEYLNVFTVHETSAISVIESYFNRYLKSKRFNRYIQEELNAMS